jgi:hypothetical protein
VLKPVPPPSKWPYVLAAIGGVTAALIAIVLISVLRPDRDNTQLITTIMTLITPTLAAILALIKGTENTQAVQELRLDIDGRLTQLLERTAQAEHAAGLARGREEGQTMTAAQVAVVTEAAGKATQAAAQVSEIAVKVAEAAAAAPPIDVSRPEPSMTSEHA